ncbi:MAG: cyclic nucleotide-binding domain-containing protein [Hyphomicrobiaceae bacterium]|nr:cyclic nucleotide-binding domain-containing protein [Hyphomicrobiaceae bacterium]
MPATNSNETLSDVTDPRERARRFLKSESTFSLCSDDFIAAIMEHSVVIRLAAGETIFRAGEPGDSLMIVLKGSVDVVNTSGCGRDVVLATMHAGSVVGEIAVLDGHARTASVVAREPVEVVAIYRHDLMPILADNTDALLALLEATCRRLRATNELMQGRLLRHGHAAQQILPTFDADNSKRAAAR